MAGALTGRGARAALVVAAAALGAWVAAGAYATRTLATAVPALPDLDRLPLAVRDAIREADAAARRAPSAASVGALGRVYHASQLPEPALAAYRLSEALAPGDWTWTYLQALLLEERGDAAARALLQRVTARAPDSGHAWYRLAEADFKAGRLDEAEAAYRRAESAPAPAAYAPAGVGSRRTWPLSAYAAVGQARIALERGHREAARTRLRALAAADAGFAPARQLLRQIEGGGPAAGSYVPPADPLVDALVAESRHSDVLLKYAGLATRAGDGAWREFLVRRALTFNPDDINVLMAMADLLQATGRPADALTPLARVEALAPGDHHALVAQGRALADLGRLQEAEAVLGRAVRVRDAAAAYNLGVVLDRQGRWDEARARYTQALAINPYHTRAMNNLGAGLARRGATPGALAWLARAVAIEPDTAEFHTNYGSALTQAGRVDEAVAALTTAIGLDPRDPNPHNNLGIARARQGRLADARAAFEQALQRDPRHAGARDNLARVSAVLAAGTPPR